MGWGGGGGTHRVPPNQPLARVSFLRAIDLDQKCSGGQKSKGDLAGCVVWEEKVARRQDPGSQGACKADGGVREPVLSWSPAAGEWVSSP